MADWKTHINYNYNPAYLTYVFQPGQNAGNLCESEVTDFSSNNVGVTQTYCTTSVETQEESPPPRTREQHVPNGHNHYQGSGVLYISSTQTDRLLLAGSRQAVYNERPLETKRAASDSTSDSETYISPDSWGSTGSREETPIQTDPTWIKKNLYQETNDRGPDGSEDVSSSLTEEPGNGCTNDTRSAQSASKNPNTTNAKAKARTAFSESQMNILVHKFSVQRYLPPAEMKNLAEVTGLTYKQVRTWFQNRRMKLRRHQKDTSWVSERYTINSGTSIQGTVYNIPPYSTSYQGEVWPQHRMDTAFKNTSPQNVAFYMATVAPGSTGYPSWTTVPCQTAVPIRTQQRDWPTNSHVFNVAGFASGQCTSFGSKNGEAADRS